MKKLFLIAAIAVLPASCISLFDLSVGDSDGKIVHVSGTMSKGEFSISTDYTELSVKTGIEVVLISADDGRGVISADENVLDHVVIEQKDGRVSVSYESGIRIRGVLRPTVVSLPASKRPMTLIEASSTGKIKCEHTVKGNALRIKGSSSSRMELDVEADNVIVDLSSTAHLRGNVVSGEMRAELSSSSSFEGSVNVRRLDADLNSAARFQVSGTADECRVKASSSAGFRGFDLVCRNATADVSSAGAVEFTVTEELKVNASSAGRVRYKGSPRIEDTNISSGGSFRRAD